MQTQYKDIHAECICYCLLVSFGCNIWCSYDVIG